MKRNLARLADREFDLVVVGGGIYGAAVARDASLRGLSVALIEMGDFGHATSANSLKTIHGGLRYLQQGDFARMRESARERAVLMSLAPHLVHPLPCLMPTYGHGLTGREAMAVALALNDLITFRTAAGGRDLPRGRIVSRDECLALAPGVDADGLTGGALWYDAQAYNTERLTLAFVQSAHSAGAEVANYLAVTGFVRRDGRVVGVEAEDRLSGGRLRVLGRTTVNTSGPWLDSLLATLPGERPGTGLRLAKAVNLITRPLFGDHAVAVSSRASKSDPEALLDKGNRLLFVSPWRGKTMIGTSYVPYDESPDGLRVTEEDVQRLLGEISDAVPSAGLRREDVLFVHAGLVPVKGVAASGAVRRAKQARILDHEPEGAPGLVSVVGVKYTTARGVAEKVVDRVLRMQGRRRVPSPSASTPLVGGDLDDIPGTIRRESLANQHNLGGDATRTLVYNYGSRYPEVLRLLSQSNGSAVATSQEWALVKAQVLLTVREEMALTLTDVLFRRTGLASAGYPGDDMVEFCAGVMAGELGWSRGRVDQELAEAREVFAWNRQFSREREEAIWK